MLAAAVIVFREVLEAALIAGIMLAATRGVDRSRAWIAAGIAGGLVGSAVLATSAGALSDALAGMGQELFNATILLVAVAMLAWHNAWMSKHGRELAAEMRKIGHAVSMGSRPLSVLAVVVGVAVLREGAETVLFLFGVTASGGEGAAATVAGIGLGIAGGVGVGALIYRGLVAVPTRHLFTVTSWLVTLLAAGMAAQAVAYLSAAGLIDTAVEPLWDTSAVLSENSIPGRLLHTLVGYVDQPSLSQLLAYGATLAGVLGLGRFAARNAAAAPAPAKG